MTLCRTTQPASILHGIVGLAAVMVFWSGEPPQSASAAPVPWAASRLTGTPDPPPPLQTRRVYEHLRFPNATCLATAPGSDRFFVTQQYGRIDLRLTSPRGRSLS